MACRRPARGVPAGAILAGAPHTQVGGLVDGWTGFLRATWWLDKLPSDTAPEIRKPIHIDRQGSQVRG
jgi:hypothetical protein